MEPGWQPARPWLLIAAAAGHLTWRDAHFLNIPPCFVLGWLGAARQKDTELLLVIIGAALIINTNTQCGAIYTVVLSVRRIIEKFSKHLEDH